MGDTVSPSEGSSRSLSSDPAALRERCGHLEFECSDTAFELKLLQTRQRLGALDNGTHFFGSWGEFEAWKVGEEERLTVSFVMRSSYISRKSPPLFKKHTTFICSRQRKVETMQKAHDGRSRAKRKADDGGCPASISVRTFHDCPIVHVAYAPDHSHDVGEANVDFIPSLRKKRRLAAKRELTSSRSPSMEIRSPSLLRDTSNAPTPPPGIPQSTNERLHEAVSLFAEIYDNARCALGPLPSFDMLEAALVQLHNSTADASHGPSTAHGSAPTSFDGVDASPPDDRGRVITLDNLASTTTDPLASMSQRWMQVAQGLSSLRRFSSLSELPGPAVTLLERSLSQLLIESTTASVSDEGPEPLVAGDQSAA
ncbi:hypothetical protein HDZ31DRAFT_59877 [Schizophyllum fasciatum]